MSDALMRLLIFKEIFFLESRLHMNQVDSSKKWPAESEIWRDVAPVVSRHFLWKETKKKKLKKKNETIW